MALAWLSRYLLLSLFLHPLGLLFFIISSKPLSHKTISKSWALDFYFSFSIPLCSVQFSCSVMSNSFWPHGLQHARLPCPSPTPRACSNLCLWSHWCHPTISSLAVPFSSNLQSFPASGSFPLSQFFTSGGQSIGVSASASVLPMNIQDWFPLGWTGWISLQAKSLFQHHSSKASKPVSLVNSSLEAMAPGNKEQ